MTASHAPGRDGNDEDDFFMMLPDRKKGAESTRKKNRSSTYNKNRSAKKSGSSHKSSSGSSLRQRTTSYAVDAKKLPENFA